MDIQCRVKINLQDGSIELEGPEAFVSKYLDEFKGKLQVNYPGVNVDDVSSTAQASETIVQPGIQKTSTHRSISTKTKSVKPEQFDIEKDTSNPSLKEYLNSKYQGNSAWERIMVVGYYITRLKQKELFTEGNVEYAYRVLGLTKRPLHLRQAFIDIKNKKQWLEEDEENKGWRLQRAGEIHVEEKLVIKK